MARIPQQFIDELLTRVDIVDIIDKTVPLKKKGANYSACCPFHNEKTPSFTVSQPKQFYYCFGCGASGNALGFLIEHDRLNFVEAVKSLAAQVGMEVPTDVHDDKTEQRHLYYTIMQQASEFYQTQLRNADTAVNYLKQRGLTGKIAKQFQLGYAPAGWENLRQHLQDVSEEDLLACGLLIKNEHGKVYDRFRDRIMFPIRDRQGRTIGFGGRVLSSDDTPKYLNSPETVIFHKGSELYGLYEAQQANRQLEQIIVVEGYMDVIGLAQHGVTNTVATLGTATTKQNAERLFRYCDNIIFSFDGDKAGRTAAWRALENILLLLEDGLNVRFLFLPEGEDPDSLIRQKGKPGFEKNIEHSLSCADFLLKHLSQDVNLNTVEGRSRFTKLAEPYIKQIPGKIFQQLMLEELAKRSQLDPDQLRELLGLPRFSRTRDKISSKNKKMTHRTIMQKAIGLIVQQPSLAKSIENPESYASLTLPGADLLNQLLEKCIASPNLSTGALLAHWPEKKTQRWLAELAAEELLTEEQQYSIELSDSLKKLIQLDHKQKEDLLHQRLAAGELSDEEKQAYANSLKP
jgi:DNA primase